MHHLFHWSTPFRRYRSRRSRRTSEMGQGIAHYHTASDNPPQLYSPRSDTDKCSQVCQRSRSARIFGQLVIIWGVSPP